MLYHDDPYLTETSAKLLEITPEGGLLVDNCLFYPTGGGQPGDTGLLEWEGGRIGIATTIKAADGRPILVPDAPSALPPVGADLRLSLDWERRHQHMRVHTALHLLSVVIPLPVTGGQIGAGKGRLDFLMPEPPKDPAAIEAALNALIDRDLPVTQDWITEAELDANPGLVKTMSVSPPRGAGRIRLVRIGSGSEQVDLQPCGGTDVARTGEIGRVVLGRIENKGKQNRRVNILLD